MQHLVIARILAPHGIKGELKADILSDFPKRFADLLQVRVGNTVVTSRPYDVESTRLQGRQVLLKLSGIDSVESAESLRGQSLFIPVSDAPPLGEDEYYWYQIIGLDVETLDGVPLGQINEILRTGSNDVYVVKGEYGEILVPAIEDVIKEIDTGKRRLIIDPLPGLLD